MARQRKLSPERKEFYQQFIGALQTKRCTRCPRDVKRLTWRYFARHVRGRNG